MKNYHIWTIGCQMNKADSERLESAMGQIGLSSVKSPDHADVVVLNSCVVRQSAEDKVTNMLGTLETMKQQHPNKIVALMGCMVGPKTDMLAKKFPQVDVFMRPQQFEPLLEVLGDKLDLDVEGCIGSLTARTDVTAFIPIIHGCDKFCSFCIIPYRRGREVSREIEDVTKEVTLLANRGVKEVTLLGQNVDSYGHDLKSNVDLGDLLFAVNGIDGLHRVRFLTSHPNDMSEHIIDSVAQLDKVCEHVNLPFQAGDDEVLKHMRRGYTNDEYRQKIDQIRERVPNVSLSTDVIVGFAGESNEQFQRTYDLIEDIKFTKVHAASYSKRQGTIADRLMDDNVSGREKKERLKAISSLQETIQTESNNHQIGHEMEILIEGRKRGMLYGRNRNDKLVFIEGATDMIGKLVKVKVIKTGPWSFQGSLVALV